MREIKFRAWYRGKMYRFVEHHSHPDGSSGVNCLGVDMAHMFSPGDEVELMQYTGLKDKNSKEVCEGDIVKVAKNSRLLHVIWNEGAFCWDLAALNAGGSPVAFTGLPHATFEVIGNIWENGDLLGVKDA